METLAILLQQRREKEGGKSLRDLGREIGVAHTTVEQVLDGKPVKLETLIKVANYLGVSPSTFLEIVDAETSDDEAKKLAVMIKALLETEPRLAMVLEQAYRRLAKGEIPLQTFSDVVEYAAFKIGQTS